MPGTPNPKFVEQLTFPADDEINLGEVAGSLLRQKKIIACTTGIAVILSILYAFIRKPVWEGQFQIVLEERHSSGSGRLSQLAASNPMFSNLLGQTGVGTRLKTEVKVLESPSVLKPTYDFVKAKKAEAGESTSNLSFMKWRKNNLDIELEKGTSVLNISYRDTDKDLVLEVIERISNDYQLYSGRDRSKSISNGLKFVKGQVTQFRKQAAISSRALDAFAIRYGIETDGGSISSSAVSAKKLIDSMSSVSSIGSIGSMNPLGPSESNQRQGSSYNQLAAINQELFRRKKQFKSNDPVVRSLVRDRDAMRQYIELTAGGILTLPGQQPAGKEQAQEILLEFQELRRTATRDIQTLKYLESSLLSLQLEQARQTDAWELITNPTVLDKPVAPVKKMIAALGLIGGLFLSCIVGLIRDRSSGLVYSEDALKRLLPFPLLKHLPAKAHDEWTDAADLLVAGPLSEVSGGNSVALIPLGKIPSEQLQIFSSELRRALNGRELLVSSDLRETIRCTTQLLIVLPGTVTRNQLEEFRQRLRLQRGQLAGWVLLNT